jgi:hydrogenase expression/formation protein HypC
MCLGIPLKIVNIDGNFGIGEMNGIKRKVRCDFIPDIKIGDYVMVHAGFAMERMDEASANSTADAFLEIEEIMKEVRN